MMIFDRFKLELGWAHVRSMDINDWNHGLIEGNSVDHSLKFAIAGVDQAL